MGFKDELDAAKRVNQIYEKLKIPPRNPEISTIPYEQYEKKEKTSQFKGVHWHKDRRKWVARIYPKGLKQKFGGYFEDELDAAKKVNQLCQELEIPPPNPDINAMPNQQSQKKKKRHHNI